MEGQQPHILLSSMGIRPQSATYSWNGAFETSTFSAMALCKLLPPEARPEEIWFLLTPEAGRNWPRIDAEAKSFGMTVKPIDLTGDVNDAADFLEQTARSIPERSRLTLNVTDGLRHHAFLFYALALYLTAFRDVHIEGVWYCRLETENRDDPKPVIDLKPVLELARWFHALAVFREQGIAHPMAELIRPSLNEMRRCAQEQNNDLELHRRATELDKTITAIERHSFAYAAALPVEMGKASLFLAERIRRLAETELGNKLPLASSLGRIMAEAAAPTAFTQPPVGRGNWKETIQLNGQELERQARMIDAYLERGQLSLAIGLMREWVISWVIWKRQSSQRWLGYSARKPHEQRLGGIGAILKNVPTGIEPTPDQRDFGEFWNKLGDELRNALLHHGMRQEAMEDVPSSLNHVRQFWSRLRSDQIEVPSFGGGHKRLLICPIGLTPGVLYSAIRHTIPDRVLVVCFSDSAGAIDEALAKAGRTVEVRRLLMTNAFTGIDEFASLIGDASAWLFEADEVHANLTGGTTLMGALVGEFVKRAAREYQRPVREFVLIDKRSPEQQRTDPWRVGDIHYMDGGSPDPIEQSQEVPKDADAVAAHESPSDDPRTPTEDRA